MATGDVQVTDFFLYRDLIPVFQVSRLFAYRMKANSCGSAAMFLSLSFILLLRIRTFPIPPCFFNVSKTLPSTLNASQLGLSSMSCTNGEDRSEGSSNTRTKLNH